ncbi:MAG: WD40/YVTN/BNR-like repeat-containing protein [Salinibacter sp.]
MLRRPVFLLAAALIAGLLAAPSSLLAQPTAGPASVDTALYRDLDARMVGPTRGGRVTAVEGHPAHPHTFYMGAAGGGGIWKTTDYGDTWTNLTDGENFRSTAIGALEVPAADTSVVYAGTGSESIRANVTTGRGVYKSTDAGESWDFLGLPDAGQIGDIETHPQNPDRVFVAALGHPFGKNEQRGVFRSVDGGDTWEKVLYASDSTGAVDLAVHPENPDVLYATMWRAERKPWTIISGGDNGDGLYKSTDGGDTWTRLENGLPSGLVGKIDLAVTPAAPDRVYALVEAPGDQQGLYRSDDAGESWRQVTDKDEIMSRPFYFTHIFAHPKDPDQIFVGNVRYWVSDDGGKTFKKKDVPHVDVHDLWVNPERPRLRIQGNDGGATVSLNGGTTWSTQHNQPTAELYQVNVDDRFPYWLYAGQQDNSTIGVPNLPPAESAPAGPEGWWKAVGGCETGPAVPQPNTPVVFSNCKGRFSRFNFDTGQTQQYWVGAQYMYGRNPAKLKWRFQRVVPIEVSPHDSSVVYHASQHVHKTTDGGVHWTRISPDLTAFKDEYQMRSGGPITNDITGEEHFSTLYAVQVSPHDPDVIWTGANDGPVHVTRDGGDTWTNVTPPGVPPNGRVDAISPSPHEPGTATVAIQRRLLKDFAPYIYRTTDYGETWTRVTDGIPSDYPVRTVREDPNREGLLYAGTDFGLFVSFDAGQHWQPLQRDLPVTPVTDIRIQRTDLVLSTMGRSFWVFDNLTPLYQVDAQVAAADHHLFAPKDAYRMRYRSGRRGPSGPTYPAPGATIDFVLSDTSATPVTLDILNDQKEVVRRFVGTTGEPDEAAPPSDERTMGTPPVRPSSIDTFAVHQGHNRFRWDLRAPSGDGPLVAPGPYRVRLSTGDWRQTRSLAVTMDPRLRKARTTRSDLEEQAFFNQRLQSAIAEAEATAEALDSMRTRVKDAHEAGEMSASEAQPLLDRLDALHGRLVTSEEGSYQPPMLIDQLGYLAWMTGSADQELGEDAFARFETLRTRLDRIQNRWQSLRADLEVPATD